MVDTTVEVANKVGAAHIIGRVVDDLKDENEQYRKMVLETIEKVMANLGASEVDARLEELLVDGILYAFQEQTNEVRRDILTLPVPTPDEERKLTLIFMKALKGLRKTFRGTTKKCENIFKLIFI